MVVHSREEGLPNPCSVTAQNRGTFDSPFPANLLGVNPGESRPLRHPGASRGPGAKGSALVALDTGFRRYDAKLGCGVWEAAA